MNQVSYFEDVYKKSYGLKHTILQSIVLIKVKAVVCSKKKIYLSDFIRRYQGVYLWNDLRLCSMKNKITGYCLGNLMPYSDTILLKNKWYLIHTFVG